MIIRIKPVDMLFFRDGRPFVRGEDFWSTGRLFPPLTTMYGALRSAYFAIHSNELCLAKTEKDPTSGLIIKRMLPLVNGSEILYPAPADLVCWKEDSDGDDGVYRLFRMLPEEKAANVYSSMDNAEQSMKMFVLKINGERVTAENVPDLYISADDLMKYMSGSPDEEYKGYSLDRYIGKEPKISIGRNDSLKAVETGMLYRIDQIRYKDIEILVEFEGLKLPENGYLKLGGKGNAAVYQEFSEKELIFDNPVADRKTAKLCLTAPGIFKNGWLPDFFNTENYEGELDGKRVKLIGACVQRPVCISGFDMKDGREKPMKYAAPAGSVYLMRLEEQYSERRAKPVNLSSENHEQGYGAGFIIYE